MEAGEAVAEVAGWCARGREVEGHDGGDGDGWSAARDAEGDYVEADRARAGGGVRAGARAVGVSAVGWGSAIHGDCDGCCDEAVFFCGRWRVEGSTKCVVGYYLE